MVTGRGEPFQVALSALRERLRGGALAPGARMAAVELAEDLGLSATPVREALSRLAGEGLIEDRRGQGYFIRSLSALDVADLYRLNLAQLTIAADEERGLPAPGGAASPLSEDPVQGVEQLFLARVRLAGSRALATAHRTVAAQLGPVRRNEPLIFADLAAEAARLVEASVAADAGGWLERLGEFHARRIAAADRLSTLLERGGPGSIDSI